MLKTKQFSLCKGIDFSFINFLTMIKKKKRVSVSNLKYSSQKYMYLAEGQFGLCFYNKYAFVNFPVIVIYIY